METLQLDISHGCFQGSYGAFDALRLAWSQAAGYGVSDHRYGGGPVVPNISFELYTHADSLGDWPDGAPDDPLIILLVHYETEGRIQWQHCPVVADRLQELESVLLKAYMTPMVLATQQFVRGLRTAAHYRQDVEFS